MSKTSKINLDPGQAEHVGQGKTTLAICLGLVFLVTLVYGQVAWHDFVSLDDDIYIYENPQVLRGLSGEGTRWAVTTWHYGNWHPLTWISLMLDAEIYGNRAGGFHVTNLLIHIANVLLLFAVLRQMTGAVWRSAMVAALFAVHPLHVESVAWVTERKDVLSTLFWILSMLAYTAYARRGGLTWYALTAGLMGLGLMAKPMLVTLPCVLLLLDFWPLRRMKVGTRKADDQTTQAQTKMRQPVFRTWPVGWLVLEKIPLIGLSVASAIMTILSERSGASVRSLEVMPIDIRLANAVVAYVAYLGKLVWPVKLAVLYPHHGIPPIWQVACALLVIGAITIWALWALGRRSYRAVGWFWFLGTMVPVIGVVQVGAQAMADRFTYVPLIGIYVLIAWGVTDLAARWPVIGRVAVVAIPAAILGLSLVTWNQLGIWKNSQLLFRHTLAVTDGNFLIENNLGSVLMKEGRVEEAERNFREAMRIKPGYFRARGNLCDLLVRRGQHAEAISLLRDLLRMQPENADAYNSLGVALVDRGEHEAAIMQFRRALKFKPDDANVHYNLGKAVRSQGNVEEGIRHYRRALTIQPDNAAAHNNLAVLLARQGELNEAIRHYGQALQSNPDYAEAHNNLGKAMRSQGNTADASSHYQEALRIKPDYPEAHYNLGDLLGSLGDREEAIKHYRRAIQLKPDLAEGHYSLGLALASQGAIDKAISHYRKAIEVKPGYGEAHNNLGTALASQGKLDAAIRQFRDAVRSNPDSVEAQMNLGTALELHGKSAEAIGHYRAALKINPGLAEGHYKLGVVLASQGKLDEAIGHYRQALQLQPDHTYALNSLAWLLATCPDTNLRQPEEALELARRASSTAKHHPGVLYTLAAAHAAVGQFEAATTTAQKALELATASQAYELANRIRKDLESYRKAYP